VSFDLLVTAPLLLYQNLKTNCYLFRPTRDCHCAHSSSQSTIDCGNNHHHPNSGDTDRNTRHGRPKDVGLAVMCPRPKPNPTCCPSSAVKYEAQQRRENRTTAAEDTSAGESS
jgi:hypothetical protein